LRLDASDIERRYRTLSREFHPDFFHNAAPAERRESLERSSYLNAAYRTLRDPVARVAYLLELEGVGSAASTNGHAKVPASLLEDVFELNEELAEVRSLRESGANESEWRPRLERARQPIEERRAEHEAAIEALAERWDAIADGEGDLSERPRLLAALKERLLERNYITNLLADVERTGDV